MLEALLIDYSGTIFLVSHDRAFLDNVVTQTIAYEGEGRWREYVGGYADTEAARARGREVERPVVAATPKPARGAPGPLRARSELKPQPQPKLGFKEQRELAALPERIATLEAEQAALAQRLADPALYREGPGEALRLQQRASQIEGELDAAMQRWDALERRAALA